MRIGCVTCKLAARRLFPLFAAALIAFTAPSAIAQTASPTTSAPQAADAATKAPEFDVISIRPNQSVPRIKNGVEYIDIKIGTPPDGYSVSNYSLKMLIMEAYGIKYNQISGGPSWIDSDHFDIDAKVVAADGTTPQPLTNEQRNLMLRSLLADRFKLAIHNDTKQLPVYELVVAKNDLKLQPAKPGVKYKLSVGTGGIITFETAHISELVDQLSTQLHRPVIDKTGLTGKFDIKLEWARDTSPSSDAAANDTSGPSIFTAVQEQLGLKLVPTKGPVETIVIDHAEHPSAN